MKIKFLGVVMSVTLLGTVGGSLSHAETEEIVPSTKATTKVEVEFTPNEEGETPPTNPEKPGPGEEIQEPEGGNGGHGGKGALRIDWAPSFNFGKKAIVSSEDGLKLPVIREEKQKVAHFVQVSDLRGEEEPNWTLNVTGTPLTKSESEASRTSNTEITGAQITFSPAAIKQFGEEVDASEKPKWQENAVINLGKKLDEEQSDTLVTANGEGARGIWSMAMSDLPGEGNQGKEDENINLVIPQKEVLKIRKGKYSATLNWNLTTTIGSTFMEPTTK